MYKIDIKDSQSQSVLTQSAGTYTPASTSKLLTFSRLFSASLSAELQFVGTEWL